MENHFQVIQNSQETNHHITQVIEVDPQNKEIHEISHKIIEIINTEITIHERTQTEENCLIPVPIQTLGIGTNHEIHHTIEIETIPTIETEAIQKIEIIIYPNNRSRNNPYNSSNYQRSNNNYQNRSKNNSQNRNSNFNNKQRNYSQSPHRNDNR